MTGAWDEMLRWCHSLWHDRQFAAKGFPAGAFIRGAFATGYYSWWKLHSCCRDNSCDWWLTATVFPAVWAVIYGFLACGLVISGSLVSSYMFLKGNRYPITSQVSKCPNKYLIWPDKYLPDLVSWSLHRELSKCCEYALKWALSFS